MPKHNNVNHKPKYILREESVMINHKKKNHLSFMKNAAQSQAIHDLQIQTKEKQM